MSKLVELYVKEITKVEATMTIADVPIRLRSAVEAAIESAKNNSINNAGE